MARAVSSVVSSCVPALLGLLAGSFVMVTQRCNRHAARRRMEWGGRACDGVPWRHTRQNGTGFTLGLVAATVVRMQTTRRQVAAIALVLIALAPCADAAGSATKTVEKLNAAIGDMLPKAQELGYAGRFERLKPAMEEAFDFDFMAEKSLGKHWKDLSDAQKKEWGAAFREFAVANYAANLDKDGGKRFELLGEAPDLHDTVLVRGRVVDPAAEPMDLSYRLHDT